MQKFGDKIACKTAILFLSWDTCKNTCKCSLNCRRSNAHLQCRQFSIFRRPKPFYVWEVAVECWMAVIHAARNYYI